MTANTRSTPVHQDKRIRVLRLMTLAVLPLIVFSRSAWMGYNWLYEVMEIAGIFLVILGVLGRFWSILYIGSQKNQTVMQDGPYSISRHPLYFFSTLGVTGLGMMLGSVVLTLVLGGLTLLVLTITARKEEAYLRHAFGPAYDDYARRVPRILPDPTLFRTEPQVSFTPRHIRSNFFDALVFLGFIPLAELMEWMKEISLYPTFLIW